MTLHLVHHVWNVHREWAHLLRALHRFLIGWVLP